MHRWRSLDGVRAFAVLVVFAGHVSRTPFPGGFVGVDIFFVLSGFLITGLLLREHARHGSISLRAFFGRRVLRLYPALLLLCAVVLPMAAVSREFQVGSTAVDLGTALLYCFNIAAQLRHAPASLVGNLWSLSVEEQYYLLWAPAAALLVARVGLGRDLGRVLAGMVLASWGVLFGTAALLGRSGLGVAYFQLHGHLVELTLGGLLAWTVLHGVPERLHRTLVRPGVPLCGLALLMAAARLVPRVDGPQMVVLTPLLALAAAAVIGHLVLEERGLLARVFGHPLARWLGTRSYAFYLFHRPVLHLVEEHLYRRTSVILVALPLSLALADLSWRLVEQRALARKGRFERVPAAV